VAPISFNGAKASMTQVQVEYTKMSRRLTCCHWRLLQASGRITFLSRRRMPFWRNLLSETEMPKRQAACTTPLSIKDSQNICST
jgi:hypothetical protein